MLVGLHVLLSLISPRFNYGLPLLEKPILLFVGIEITAGVVYLLAVRTTRDSPLTKRLIVWIFGVGLALRACMIASTPILEDDYYRYLWDGGVAANGINPYAYAPGDALEAADSGAVPPELHKLAEKSGVVAARVNHPDLRSIYPLTAQAAFVFAHWLRPWSLTAWRLSLLVIDVATLGIVAAILQAAGLPLALIAIYWWNPLLVKELFNSGHMDGIPMLFALGAVLLSIRSRHMTSVAALALAAGAKLWPSMLLPLAVRPLISRPKQLVFAVLLFGLTVCVLFLPVYVSGFGSSSGFVAYGQRWEMNDAFFMLVSWAVRAFFMLVTLEQTAAPLVARAVVGVLLILWVLWQSRTLPVHPADFCDRALLIVAGIFLLSPAQFPWYYVWLIPFLAIRPRMSLLLLTVLLPLYYLRFYFVARGWTNVFDYGIVWLEFVPVWCLLVWEWRVGGRSLAQPRALSESTS
ncbi:MAG: DUF2029 domain-containing protein [Candidatus Abyssobacteria bacterium SURF_17]|uniref:DUF2029 domain-containing protein n=1 Tax=Candidatus Abyssobacteria bacterium SURF_17 TaxID=2093361 RepID=A0A419F8Y8_9BACT|nr:MAG: DUF2029 domain-containing protein [Candidatus Abyssubacteria bacterium SURF_17]